MPLTLTSIETCHRRETLNWLSTINVPSLDAQRWLARAFFRQAGCHEATGRAVVCGGCGVRKAAMAFAADAREGHGDESAQALP